MRRLLTCSYLLLLVQTAACEVGEEADLEAEVGPDAGIDDPEEEGSGGGELRVTTPKLHLYGDRSFQGVELTRNSYDSNFANDGFNDMASSLINPTGDFWLIFEHRDYNGRKICMRPDSRLADLAGLGWNDRISSVKRVGRVRSTCGTDVQVVGLAF